MEGDDFERMNRIRDRLYQMVSADPSGPDADRARGLLSRMPKTAPTDSRMPAAKPDEVTAADVQVPFTDTLKTWGAKAGQAGEVGLNAVSNAADTASLGYYRKARDLVGGAISPEATAQAQSMEKGAESTPVGKFVGGLGRGAGYLTGAPSLIAKGATRGIEAAASRVPEVFARALRARPVAGALTGAATGGGVAASESAVRGDDLATVGENALTGAEGGAIIGGGIGTVSAAAGKVASKLAENPNRQLITRHGGEITPTSPASGGAFDDPLLQAGLDAHGNVTDVGIGKVARTAARQVREDLNLENKAGVGIYKAEVNKLRESGALEGKHDITSLAEQARSMADDIESYTADTRSKVASEILPVLEKYKLEDGSYEASAEAVNKLRQKIAKVAKFQTRDGVVKDKDIGRLARMAKELVDETAMAEPNAAAAERISSLKEAHRGLNIQGNSRSHTGPDDMAAEKTLTDLITRRGQNTVTAGKYETPELANILATRPELALPLDSAALLRARGAMQYMGGGKHGGLIERLKHPLGALMQVAEPIGQRLVYPVAQRMAGETAIAASGPGSVELSNPIFNARQKQRQRDAENARILGGGR